MSVYAKVISAALIVVLSAILFCIAGYDASAFKRCKALGKVHSTFLAVLVIGIVLAAVPKPPSGDDPSGAPGGLCMAPPPQQLLSPSPDSAAPQFAPFTNVIERLTVTGLVRAGTSTWYRVGWTPSDPAPAFLDLLVSDDLTSADWTFLTRLTVLPAATNLVVEVPDALMPGTNCVGFVRFGLPLDSDGDGTTDAVEHYVSHTNPHRDDRDDDHDGLSVADELGAAYVLEDDFLWFEPSDNWNYIRQDRGANWMNISLTEGVSIDGTRYCQIHTTWDGIVHLYPNDDYTGWEYAHGDLLLSGDLANDPLSGGFVTVIAADADVYYRPTAWGSGVFVSTVVTNGTSYDVIECRNVGLESESTSGTNSLLSYEIILPRDEPNVVYVSYARVDEGFRALGMNLGLQCQMLRNPVATNEFYHLHSPVSGSNLVAGTTIRYEIGTATDPTESDSDGDGILDGYDPFPRDASSAYFGQCEEWVRANAERLVAVDQATTNVGQILSVGYPQWVDDCVGIGLTNGLYKLTATVTEVPATPLQLVVGDLVVAVTNAGNYVFLLGKCIDYSVSVTPSAFTNVVFSMVDDVAPAGEGFPGPPSPTVVSGYWTADDGGRVFPALNPMSPSHVLWKSCLYVSPSNWNPTPSNASGAFASSVYDIPFWLSPRYRWNSSDSRAFAVERSNDPYTTIEALFPFVENSPAQLALNVDVGSVTLHSEFSRNLEGFAPLFRIKTDMPDTVFVNNDDDDGDGRVDWSQGPLNDESYALEDDIVHVTVTAESLAGPTNGVLRLLSSSASHIEFYSDARLTRQVDDDAEWSFNASEGQTIHLWINPCLTSDHYEDQALEFEWEPTVGFSHTVSVRFTVVEPVAESITDRTIDVEDDDGTHRLAVNPIGVGVGKFANFHVDARPEDYQDSKIRWKTKSYGGTARLLDGTTGRDLRVYGEDEGAVDLKATFGDRETSVPSFRLSVYENSVVHMNIFILGGREGRFAMNETDVMRRVAVANGIFAQVAMSFVVDSVEYVLNPSAYNVCESNGNEICWDVDRLLETNSASEGLKCYFVNSFVVRREDGSISPSTTTGLCCSNGIIVGSRAVDSTLAHELGHACGMHDIYDERSVLSVSGCVSKSRMPEDWTGGCDGVKEPGSRYYEVNRGMNTVISRMLMNGHSNKRRFVHITHGAVWGVSSESVLTNVLVGYDLAIPPGGGSHRSPRHR